MSRITLLTQLLLCVGCSPNSEENSKTKPAIRTVAQPQKAENGMVELAVPVDTSRIDTSRISRLTQKEALRYLGEPFEQEEYDFPNANAAGLREGLTQYISINSKKQVRIRQLTWKRGKHLTTVFYHYTKSDWRPLYLYSWREGMVF